MTLLDRIAAALQAADAAGNADDARALAAEYRRVQQVMSGTNTPEDPTANALPTAGPVDNLLAGAGKGFVDMGRGIAQTLLPADSAAGQAVQSSIEESRKRDAPLMETGAGIAGNVLGNVAAMAPTVLVPAANTLGGATAIGAVSGLLAPSLSDSETLANTAIGGAAAPAAMVAGRAVRGAVQGARSLLEPVTQPGRERIAARVLREFATNADDAARAATGYRPATPGVQPTLAEATLDPGLATLQRSLGNPQISGALAERGLQNRAAMVGALRDIAGDDAAMAAARQAREAAVAPLYGAAKAQDIPIDDTLRAILDRPVAKAALAEARRNAANRGVSLNIPSAAPRFNMTTMTPESPTISGDALHSLKMALDDALKTGPQRGIGAEEAASIADARGALLNWLETQIPDYATARTTYSAMSRPINQMEIGRYMADKLVPALTELGEQAGAPLTRTAPQAYAQALRNADQMAAKATGFPGATLANVMEPSQIATLQGVGHDLARAAAAQDVGRAVGSNTGQNLAAQNLVNRIIGPLGLSPRLQPVADIVMAGPLRAASTAFKPWEPQIQAEVGQLLLDPRRASAALRGNPQLRARVLQMLPDLTPALSTGVAGYAAQQ